MENTSLQLDGETLSQVSIPCFKINKISNSFNEFRELLDTFPIEWGFCVSRYGLYVRCNQTGNPQVIC